MCIEISQGYRLICDTEPIGFINLKNQMNFDDHFKSYILSKSQSHSKKGPS